VARELVVFGISHHRTPVAVRERMASSSERVSDDLQQLLREEVISEGVLLSTCNRVELVAVTDEPHRARERVLGYFEQRAAPEGVSEYVYEHAGSDAVKHLFRVAAGLDSMVLGEPQILGQVKEAVAVANRAGALGGTLGRCFDRTFSVAKRVRTETDIASGNVSVSSIACELAEKIFSDLSGRKVLLIGAGKMSEVAARSLKARGAQLTVINRSPERAAELAASCGGEPRPLEALATELAAADVVISSTAKEGFVITHELMLGVAKMRKWRPLFMIDIAVPRDIDPRVEGVRNVFLYDMDDLKRVSHANLAAREQAAADAERIIDDEVRQYGRWLRQLELTPTIVALRERVHAVVQKEKQKAMTRMGALDPKAEQAIDAMCDAIVGQLLHAPLSQLKQSQESGQSTELVSAVQRLFALEVSPGPSLPPPPPLSDKGKERSRS
jgi:glutamyl-tRNA reductase